MAIKPTMRERTRYICFRIDSGSRLGKRQAEEGVFNAILSFLGERGFSKANPRLIQFSPADGAGVLRCTATEMEQVRSSLALLSSIGDFNVAVRLLGNSGSLKRLRERLKAFKKHAPTC